MPKYNKAASLNLKDSEYIISLEGKEFTRFNSSSFSKEVAEEVFNAIIAAYMHGQDS